MKPLQYITVLFAITATITSCQHASPAQEARKEKVCITDSMAKLISIDSATISQVDDELNLSGEVSFDDNKVVKVYPFSSGQVVQVSVSLGDKVTKGQTLAIIKSADVAGSYSDLTTAGNDVAIAKKQMDNAEALFKNGISSEREYIEAKENYSKAGATAKKIQEQININGGGHTSANGSYVITAPMSGYVVEKKINAGAFIRNDNAENLFTIGDIRDVWVWANVYESDISRVKQGYSANITTLAYPGKIFKGTVDKVNQLLDPDTKVMKIRIRLPNDSLQLKPEMFANIMIENREGREAISIPSTALINENGNAYVIVYHDKCNLQLAPVTVTKTVGGKVYVSKGIEAGDKVISKNQVLLFRALAED